MLLPYGPANPGARALMSEARLRQTPAWPDNEKVSFRPGSRRGSPASGNAGPSG